ncbi:MAG: nucleotidyltransferase domain-containing protein [Bacteroidota bacterium]|nr:nucleotidyltransferase domain-containing protein [Bacteroidota bacterium]
MDQFIVNDLKQYFSSKPVNKAYLFGSFARNEFKNESDIDILVELRKEAKVDLFEFIKMKLDLESLLKKPIDLLSAKGISKHIKSKVDEEKILIYEKSKLMNQLD